MVSNSHNRFFRRNLVGVVFLSVSSVVALLLIFPKPLTGSNLPRFGDSYHSLLELFDDSTGTQGEGRRGGPPPRERAEPKPSATGDEEAPALVPKSLTDSTSHQKSLDSAYVVYLDSTARMEQFGYVRRDEPQVQVFARRSHPLFAVNRAAGYKRDVKLDSSGTNILFREIVAGQDVKIPTQLSLREYADRRMRYEFRKMMAEEAHKSKALAGKKDIGELMSSITKIQIPIPSNPILSIFGKPEINLNISGAVDIKAGFRNTKSDQTQISALDQSRNEPDFNQEVQVNVNGTVGDKLNILADWNTQRTFEYENQLKIKYTGYEDEIVQSIEAGNVSLQTPSSYVGSSQALFGVKARFQTGPLTLTTLASQKKGQIKEVAVSGGAQEVPFEIRAWNYSTNHFFVDTLPYRAFYEPYYKTEPITITSEMQNAQIIEEEVWVQLIGTDPTQIANARQGVALISLSERGAGYDSTLRTSAERGGAVEAGRFVRLDRSQYEMEGEGYLGVISLPTSVQDQQIVAIAYRRSDGRQFGEFSRDLVDTSGNKPLILKMVRPKNLISNGTNYPLAWSMMLKNIYSLTGIGRNVKKEGFTLDIYRQVPGQEQQNSILNERLLRVFGFDKYNSDDTPAPNGDGLFDFRPNRTVNQARAEIIFPYLRPFDTGMKSYFREQHTPPITLEDTSEYVFKQIYDTTRTFAQQSPRDLYVIRGKATGEASSKFNLGFNVVEGSVQVLLDGRQLTPNIDFTVDYIVGEVVIRNASALVPGANLQIKYEQNDLFQLASKTLLAARGDLALSQSTNLGFTVMNLNQQTLSDKVRLGEEPSRNTIFGLDGATTIDLPFLTKGLDALPLLQTRELSNLKISGEGAYMLPDPNTKKSTIASDAGESIAYIDDFEGAKRTIPLGITYNIWTQASPPKDSVANGALGVEDTTKMLSKGKIIWYNVLPTDVHLREVYPKKEPGNAANDQITVLDLKYSPLDRGQFNYSTDLSSTLTRQKNWGGVMKPISVTATNLINENINYIELWMKVDAKPESKMIIDMGALSERVIPNGRNSGSSSPNSEDLVHSSSPNGTLQEGEDVGLDMLSNAEEIARYPTLGSDPSGDDYAYDNQTRDYNHINGTENSKNGPGGLIPDTEDLNSNGIADKTNAYMEYELSLDTLKANNPRIVGGGENQWFQFRIPIREYTRLVGMSAPNFENVEYMRIYFLNATDTIHVRIADFSLVGNQWQELNKGDTTFAVSVVSVEENPLGYTSPPGVVRERDKTRPNENVQANEQSLALQLKGIPEGESRQAVKYYTLRPLDLFSYKSMKMFVHPSDAIEYIDENNYDAEVFFRFGLDSLNFYEYRAPLRQDPGNDNWSEIAINFADLTVIKQGRDSINIISRPRPVPGGALGAVYRVLGNPSLTQVRYFSVGVTNHRDNLHHGEALHGQVWVNELRLTSVDDTPGWAYRFDTQLKLADLGAVSFNYSKQDPNFHRLEERFGSRQTGTNWGVNATLQLEKFFPNDWVGTSFPVSYSHTINKVSPKYLPNSDVLVSEAAGLASAKVLQTPGATQAAADAEAQRVILEAETYRVTDTYAAPTFHIGFPSQEWYIRDTFNKLTFGFTYTRSRERNPAVASHLSWSWNARISYAIQFSPDYYFAPFKSLFKGLWFLDEYKDFKIYFAPSSFNWSFGATRARDNSVQRVFNSQEIVSRNFTASRQVGFAWKLTEGGLTNLSGTYNLDIASSLLDFETDRFKNQRPFSRILDDIFFSDKFINLGQDTRYTQQNQFSSRPNIPNILNIKKYLDLTLTYGVDYNWQNILTGGDLGKSAGFGNRISATTNLRLKALFDPLFEDHATPSTPAPRGRRRGGEEEGEAHDTTKSADTTDTAGPKGLGKTFGQLKDLAKIFIKAPLLDYDNITVTFSQDNTAQNSGVVGRPGFVNFWGRVPFFQDSDPRYGPSRLYQLGLISDPSGRLTNFGPRSRFPFFGWDVEPGIRAANGVLSNTYRQTNKLTFKTTRGLWEGAKLDLNWNIGWAYSRTQNVTTDSLGIPKVTNSTTSGNIDRSFLTFPDVLFLGMFKSSLKEVSKKYAQLKTVRDSSMSEEAKITKAFEEGFEALPFLRKLFGQYYPRVNWSLRWDGLERLPIFSGFVSRLSLDHTYSSNFTRAFRNLPGEGGERTDNQRVVYGFAPLVGLNFTFKELLKGNFGTNVRYGTTTSYDLSTASRNIVETLSREVSITASYTRRGFEIPLFGLSLNNDVDISGSYAVTKNSRRTYDVTKLDVNLQGTPLDGSTRTVIEPRIKYVLSMRVTASIYYRYTKVAPDDAGSRIPGSTTNEAGLDIHIAIQ